MNSNLIGCTKPPPHFTICRQRIGPLTSCTKRVTVKGIFKGAEVVRNPNLTHDLESDGKTTQLH